MFFIEREKICDSAVMDDAFDIHVVNSLERLPDAAVGLKNTL